MGDLKLIIFFDTIKEKIKCNEQEYFGEILKKLINDKKYNIKDLVFYLNGKRFIYDNKLKLKDIKKNRYNEIKLIGFFFKNNFKYIFCPKCKEELNLKNECIINIEKYKISFQECLKEHKTSNFYLEDANNKQILNKYYITNADNKCRVHKYDFCSYCTKCKSNLCYLCEKSHEHPNTNLFYYSKNIQKYDDYINNLSLEIEQYKSKINILKEQFEMIKNMLTNIVNNIEIFYNINKTILNGYSINKNNYFILKNASQINIKYAIEDINIIINEDDINKKIQNILDLHDKIININKFNIKENKKNKESISNKESFYYNEKNLIEINKSNIPKYKLKYNSLINLIQDRNDKQFLVENEYLCNILLMPSFINPSDKLRSLSLLTYSHQENNNSTCIYNIANKVEKHYKDIYNKGIKNIYFLRIFFRAGFFLKKEKNYFYSLYYLNLSDEFNLNNDNSILNDNLSKVNTLLKNYINKMKNNFIDDKIITRKIIQELNKLIESILNDTYIINTNIDKNDKNNDKNFIYAINREWLIHAKKFIENLIYAKSQNIKTFYEESFNYLYVYRAYFNKEQLKDKKIISFPGPIDNFKISSFKDYWNNNNDLDENYFIKNKLKNKENFLLINYNDWIYIKNIFGATNEIKRKEDNLNLIQLKFILFDKRMIINKQFIHLLKQKYMQINKYSNISQLKTKIINIINSYFITPGNEQNMIDSKFKGDINIIPEQNQKISFFILDINKKDILIEMCVSFINENESYESLYLTELNINEKLSVNEFLSQFNIKKNILIIELFDKNEKNFLKEIKFNNNNEYKCTICKALIKSLNNCYKCNICNFSLFCSKECSVKSNAHHNLDIQLQNIMEEKFDLKDLFSLKLKSLFPDNQFSRDLVGISKLTDCFCNANSIIQCLSNTTELTKYFLKQYFLKEINVGNSSSSLGLISKIYYQLINKIWKNESNWSIDISDFIYSFSKETKVKDIKEPIEFLNCLLDNLHNDLNRVTPKNIKKQINDQTEEESDEEASLRFLNDYKEKGNSIITDLFSGQYKATIKCESCLYKSISYAPFRILNLSTEIEMQNIIKFITSEGILIELNIRQGKEKNKDTKFKDIIMKAIMCIDKKKYYDFYKIKEQKISNEILYNNILINIFGNDHKLIKIYNTSYESISNCKNNINNKNIIDNIILQEFINKNKNSEIVLYEKNLINVKDYINIYIYPIVKKEEEGILLLLIKEIIISYPIVLSIPENYKLKDLKALIFKKLSKIVNEKIIKKFEKFDIIELYIPHFFQNWGEFNINIKECPFCKRKYNSQPKFCSLSEIKDDIYVYDIINKLGKDKKNILILYANSYFYDSKLELISGLKLFKEMKDKNIRKKVNLYELLCLKKQILEKDKIICKKCLKVQKMAKTIEIYKIPYYLIIKINHIENFIVEYKEVINLSDFVLSSDKFNAIYDLYSILAKSEDSYYSICRNENKWIKYENEKFKEIHTYYDENAYILFYQKRELSEYETE